MIEDLGVAFGDEAEYGRDGEEGGEGDSDNLFVSEIHVDGKKSNDDNAPAAADDVIYELYVRAFWSNLWKKINRHCD